MIKRLACLALLSACTSSDPVFSRKSDINLESSADLPRKKVAATSRSGVLTMGAQEASWFTCRPSSPGPEVVVLLEKKDQSRQSCETPFAQALLGQNYQIHFISEVKTADKAYSFGSDAELRVISEFIKKSSGDKAKLGLWAEGYRSIIGSRLAKKLPLNWLVYVDGFYDMEAVLAHSSKDQRLQNFRQNVAVADEAEIEKRSIAWDFEGLPSQTWVTFLSSSPDFLKSQAQSFQQSLAAAGFRSRIVTIQAGSQTSLTPQLRARLVSNFLTTSSP